MNKKKVIISIIIMAGVVAAGACLWSFVLKPVVHPSQKSNPGEVVRTEQLDFNADEEVENALNRYDTELEGALVIRDYLDKEQQKKILEQLEEAKKQKAETEDSLENSEGDVEEEKDPFEGKVKPTIYITFQGMSDQTINQQVLDLMEAHNRKGTFFLSGMQAAEDSDFAQSIVNEGHELGDNALNGDMYLEEYEGEDIVENLARSKKILSVLTDKEPSVCMLNSTYYTKTVCKAAQAAGYEKVVAPTPGHYLNYNSFSEYQKAKEYIEGLSGDTILVIKLAGPLDLIEYEPKVYPENPAKDKKGSVEPKKETVKLEEDNILQVLDYVLTALDEDEIETGQVSSLKAISNEDYIRQLLEDEKAKEANVYDQLLMQEKEIGLVFEGICDFDTYTELADALKENEANATFFFTGEEATSHHGFVESVVSDGYKVGISGNTSESFAGESAIECYDDISMTRRNIIKASTGRANLVMPRNHTITDELKKAAGVLGYDILNSKSASEFKAGAIYRFDLSASDFDLAEVKKVLNIAKANAFYVVDAYTLICESKEAPEIPQETIDELRTANEGKLAGQIDYIKTTKQSMSFLFYGITNKAVVKDVVSSLGARGYTATFFATFDEMKNCPEQIELLLENGHEIGIAYTINSAYPAEFDSAVKYILTCQNYMQWRYGVECNLVKLPYGECNDEIKEAVSATACNLIGQEYTMIQSSFVDEEDSSFYFKNGFSEKIGLHRGSLCYFNINYITKDKELDTEYEGETIAGSLLKKVYWTNIDSLSFKDSEGNVVPESRYRVEAVSKILNGAGRYYFSGGQSTISMNKDVLTSLSTEQEQFDVIKNGYIGNIDTNGDVVLPGFSDTEIRNLDKTGRITNDPAIFITFDDWGSEQTINKLLYVLKKHDVKATFFIKTQYVDNNPNLLRAIAADGHEIGSHTDMHFKLSTYIEEPRPTASDPDNAYTYYASLTAEEGMELRADLVKSYNKLYRYVGNVSVDGVPALSTPIFRPPTLAVSKVGLYQVFDVGFKYAVSGDFSTHDYQAGSVNELVDKLSNGFMTWDGQRKIRNGSIIVMHMSDAAEYTAQALDIMIPVWKAQGYRIARLDEYLH